MKTLISFDVDMTLLDHATYKIPDSAMEAIEALRKNHLLFLLPEEIWILITAGSTGIRFRRMPSSTAMEPKLR